MIHVVFWRRVFVRETLLSCRQEIVMLRPDPTACCESFVNCRYCPRPRCCAIKPAVDKSVERVQTKLASMLNRLELEISEVEKRIGDKMVRVARVLHDFTETG